MLEVGSLLLLVGVPLAVHTGLADAVIAPKQAVFWLGLALAGGGWLAGLTAGRPLWRGPGLCLWMALGMWLWTALATFANGWPPVGRESAQLQVGLAWLALIWTGALTRQRAERAGDLIAWVALLSGLYSWLQRLGLDPLVWSNPHLSRERTIAFFGNPDYLALYLVVAYPLALPRVLAWRPVARAFGLLGLAAGSVTWFLTLTRGAWVAALVALLGTVALVLLQGRAARILRRLGLALGALLVLWGLFALTPLAQTSQFSALDRVRSLGNLREHSMATRVFLWRAAWGMAVTHPLTGVGWGRFGYAALPYRNLEPMEIRPLQRIPEDPHSQYFLALASGGFPALLMLMLSLGTLLWGLRRQPWAFASALALAVNLVFLCAPLETAVLWVYLIALAGGSSDPRPLAWRLGAPVRVGLAVGLAAVGLYAAGARLAAQWWLWQGDDRLIVARSRPSIEGFDGALEAYRKALGWADPGTAVDIWRNLGLVYAEAMHNWPQVGELQGQALQALEVARRLCPDDPYLYFQTALALGSQPQARAAYAEAIERDPYNPNFQAALGVWLANQGQLEPALTAFNRSLELYPESTAVWALKAQALEDLGRPQEASEARSQADHLKPTPSLEGR